MKLDSVTGNFFHYRISGNESQLETAGLMEAVSSTNRVLQYASSYIACRPARVDDVRLDGVGGRRVGVSGWAYT